MSTARRIGLFALGLVAVFAAAAGIGSLVEPTETQGGAAHGANRHATAGHSEETESEMEGHTAHLMAQEPAGLGISEGGYSLRLDPTFLARDEDRELHFSITTADGETVSDFDELHERRMHLIVVRRDGADFRHLHPEMDEAGTWSVPIELAAAGVYRAFADFSVGGEQHTLATDLFVSGGEFEARPFPPPAALDSADGYEVRLRAGKPLAGESTSLTFSVARGGEEVHDLAPYLGAKGHLVALREGDLAFLHVHPEEAAGDEHGPGGHATGGHAEGAASEIAFTATFPTAGRYRLYLQFRHQGVVQTAQFTVVVPQ
jgi:hypothetical protein